MSRLDLTQENLIEVINSYLEWNNLPIKWDTKGVCRGLAILHAQYVLQNSESEFFDILKRISSLMKNGQVESSDQIDHFIAQVALISKPADFDKQYSQDDSHKLAKVNGQPLTSNFNLAMTTSADKWVQIIKKEINIKPDEVFLVSCGCHSITLQRKAGKYIVYDPNYKKGIESFENEHDLIKELCAVFEQKKSGNLGFRFQNLSLPAASTKSRPSIKYIYEHYETKDNLLKKFSTFNKEFSPINLIAGMNDSSFIDYLIRNMEPSAKDLSFLRNHALVRSQNEIFKLLNDYVHRILDPEEREGDVRSKLLEAVEAGSLSIFEYLAQFDNGTIYKQFFTTSRTAAMILRSAALGGQSEILRYIVEDAQNLGYRVKNENTPNSIFPQKYTYQNSVSRLVLQEPPEYDLLMQLINSDAHEGFVYLLSVIKREGAELPLNNVSLYLKRAIERNNYYLVKDVLNLLDEKQGQELLRNFSMSTTQALKTNLRILKLLEDKGAQFKPQILTVMKQKSTHQGTFLEWLGISLISFVEFIKEQFGKQKHLELPYHATHFLTVSKELISGQNTVVNPEAEAPALETSKDPVVGSKNHR